MNLFDRQLQQLIMQPNFNKVQALVIGRFQNASKIPRPHLEQLIKSKDILKNILIIANVDFGHTMPFLLSLLEELPGCPQIKKELIYLYRSLINLQPDLNDFNLGTS